MCLPPSQTLMDRARFAFCDAVQRTFGFLTEHHFQCVRTEPTFVRYESDRVFVNVYHGRSSYELGVEVGLLDFDKTERGYSLSALIGLIDPQEAANYRNFVATTSELVEVGVKTLSEKFKAYAWDTLRGDPIVFAKLEQQREQLSKSFAMEVLARQVRPKAEAAFRNKSYAEAARLYESIRGQLSPAELKKLEYAQKHNH